MKWLLSFSLILLPSLCEALTLSDLLTRTRLFLKDSASQSSRQRFTDTQLTAFLNDAQKEVNFRAFAVVNSSRISLSAGTTEYNLPDDFIAPLRVTVNLAPVTEKTLSFFDDSSTAWVKSSTGNPSYFYVRVSSSLTSGVSKESIGFVPLSSATIPADIEYLAQPADLSGSSDTPFGSDGNRLKPFHHVLAYKAAYEGYLIIGDMESAGVYNGKYEMLVSQMEDVLKTRIFFNPNFRGSMQTKPMEAKQ